MIAQQEYPNFHGTTNINNIPPNKNVQTSNLHFPIQSHQTTVKSQVRILNEEVLETLSESCTQI